MPQPAVPTKGSTSQREKKNFFAISSYSNNTKEKKKKKRQLYIAAKLKSFLYKTEGCGRPRLLSDKEMCQIVTHSVLASNYAATRGDSVDLTRTFANNSH